MNQDKDTGGPAFPVTFGQGLPTNKQMGLTLRDYFAGQALANCTGTPGQLAVRCYEIADAMIRERK